MKRYSGLSMREKYDRMNVAFTKNTYTYANPDEVKLKINYDAILFYIRDECYREIQVSYFPMLPLLELPQVSPQDADYIMYMHPFARCEDMSGSAIKDILRLANMRKPGAEIIVVGKAANLEEILNGSISNIPFWHDYFTEKVGQKFDEEKLPNLAKLLSGSISNITFWHDHFTEKLGQKFGIDMTEQYFVYDDDVEYLAIWPVNGCMQQCKFCRRTYMHIPFESLSLDTIQENLNAIRQEHPEWMRRISLRAENLTEYGLDVYGEPKLDALLDLLNSYDEVEEIEFPIGLSIGEITPGILNALCRLKKIYMIALNLEAGSNRLLQVIGKKHTREKAIQICKAIREAHPQVLMSTTVMVGLPTEEMTDMYDLASLIGETEMDHVLCNYYMNNPRQPLAKLPQLSEGLREYHLKIFCDALRHTPLKRECHMTSFKIYKNKKSRKYARDMERLRERSNYFAFPRHYKQRHIFMPIP